MDRSIAQTIRRSLYRPFLMLILDPMCLNLCLLSSLILGILYLFFGAFHLVFTNVYGFNLYQVGLSFIGMLVGMLFAIASDPFWQRNYLRLVRKNSNQSEPEYRLPPSIGGSILTIIGLFLFAWTIYPSVHWIVPIIGSAFFGAGTVLVFSGVFTFLVEAFPLYAASGLAANSFARSSFAAAFPLFGLQLYNKLGFQWASSLLAFLMLAMAPFPYIFFLYGRRLRQKSRFASKNR
jgi:MFS family permease